MFAKPKNLFIFFMLFILLISSIFTISVKGKDVKNPYGKKRWKLNDTSLTIIYDDEGELIDMHPDEANHDLAPGETRERSVFYGNLSMEVRDESSGQAELSVNLSDLETSYGQEPEMIDYTQFNLMIDKSNNIAYHERTKEKIGYNPFYFFAYNDIDILEEEMEKDIDIGNNYKFKYKNGYSIITVPPTKPNAKEDERVYTIDEPILGVSSADEIKYTSISLYENGEDTEKAKSRIGATGKSYYPINIDCFLPADIFMNETANERYVNLKAKIGYHQGEIEEYLNSLDLKELEKDSSVPKMLLIFFGSVISLGAILAYMAYRKKK